jgi:hypothetical protein
VAYFEIYENQSRENYGKTENTRLPCLKEDWNPEPTQYKTGVLPIQP